MACLEPKDNYESALAEGQMDDVERLLEKARKALSDSGAVACLEPKDKSCSSGSARLALLFFLYVWSTRLALLFFLYVWSTVGAIMVCFHIM